MKTLLLLLTTLTVLTACRQVEAPAEPDSSQEPSREESTKENSESTKADPEDSQEGFASLVPHFNPIVKGDILVDERGMQAWEDFKALSQVYQMADYDDLDHSQGSSKEDVLDFFEEKEEVYVHAYDEVEGSQQINFWYTAEGQPTIGDSDIPLYFAEIMTLFYDDKLVFASVQPGLYEPDVSAAMPFSNVTEEVSQIDDLISLKPSPQAYNVSEMSFRGRPLTCAGVLTEAPDDQAGSEPLLVYFTFSPSDQGQGAQSSLLIADTLPFSLASGDFGGAAFESLQAMMDMLDQSSI